PPPPLPPKPRQPRSKLGRIALSTMLGLLGGLLVLNVTGHSIGGATYAVLALGGIAPARLVGAWGRRARWLTSPGILLSLGLGAVGGGGRGTQPLEPECPAARAGLGTDEREPDRQPVPARHRRRDARSDQCGLRAARRDHQRERRRREPHGGPAAQRGRRGR